MQGGCLQQVGLYEPIRAREPEQPDHSGFFREMGDSTEGEETIVRGRDRTTHGGRNFAHWTTKRRCSVYLLRYSEFFRNQEISQVRQIQDVRQAPGPTKIKKCSRD